MKIVQVLLFDDFEILDAMGPVSVLGRVKGLSLQFVSFGGGRIRSQQGVMIETKPWSLWKDSILLVPGGQGTRGLVKDKEYLDFLKKAAEGAEIVLSVCTGAALLARAGVLDGRRATSNKIAFSWVKGEGPLTVWERQARWMRDGNVYSSSGVSAGIDMALSFVSDFYGREEAERIARAIEYVWNDRWEEDPFCVKEEGL